MRYKRKDSRRFLPLLLFFVIPLVLSGAEPEPSARVLPELHLDNADLRMVFRSLAGFGEFPVVLAPIVQGKVTLPLKPGLTAKEAVELLAGMHGYPCSWVEGTALIGAEPAALAERFLDHFQWSLASEEAVVAALTRVVPRERLQMEAGRQEVTVPVSPLEAENIREVLKTVDRSATPYLMVAELVEIELDYAQEQGLNWALPRTAVHTPLRLGAFTATDQLRRTVVGRRLAGERFWVESNRSGVAFLGDQYPVITTNPDARVNLIQYQKVGVGIEVTPHPRNDGALGLELTLTVSGIGGWLETADGRRVPQIENSQIIAQQTLAPGETCVLSGLTFTGQTASALLLTPGQEGPSKEKTVCLFLTPLPEGTAPTNTGATGKAASAAPASGAEVIHIEIFSPDQPTAVTATPVPPPTPQVLAEVVGFEPPKPSSGEATGPAGPQPGPEPAPGPTAVVAESGGEQPPVALRVAYRVVSGDTVFSIGRKYGVDPAAILDENDLPASGLLRVGQTIRIPIPANHLYQLKPKETLWRIAQRYGVTVELLMEINSITDVTALRTDQIIILPVPIDQVVNDNY
ncbi:MAG TPA: LysM peptidoglycan-binding domain-containing protein [Firmicutes bacterium]|nr:LysM peptidoglycan-binding domain-containing protein [Bacillota bacterium]